MRGDTEERIITLEQGAVRAYANVKKLIDDAGIALERARMIRNSAQGGACPVTFHINVTDVSSSPVFGALVNLYKDGLPICNGSPILSGTTDVLGNVSFSPNAAGCYSAKLSATGYEIAYYPLVGLACGTSDSIGLITSPLTVTLGAPCSSAFSVRKNINDPLYGNCALSWNPSSGTFWGYNNVTYPGSACAAASNVLIMYEMTAGGSLAISYSGASFPTGCPITWTGCLNGLGNTIGGFLGMTRLTSPVPTCSPLNWQWTGGSGHPLYNFTNYTFVMTDLP